MQLICLKKRHRETKVSSTSQNIFVVWICS